MKTNKWTISEADASLRVDKILPLHFPQHSRNYFQFLIEKGHVRVNGAPLKKRMKVKVGDEIEVEFLALPELSVEQEEIPLEILYEDNHIIAINKPAGMVVHPGAGNPSKTFANALMYHCKNLKKEDFDPLRPGIVHRLDKETSGVLIAAKTYEAHQNLVTQFSQRKIKKTYLAVCAGHLEPGLISAPIQRHPIHRKEMAVSSDGKEAITHIKVLAHRQGVCLVEAEPITGRTHQIRVHLKHKGAPVLGDLIYGLSKINQQFGVQRQYLHAYRIKFKHPLLEKILELKAPIPADMEGFISNNFYNSI
ncbi:MAG TPA: RluA family pseudouridine synthase [Rhabdochlamydiaceae bacterium]|nr:RluA family pseudouridine synthase [Rhabdochlamydiaceae bacterium]